MDLQTCWFFAIFTTLVKASPAMLKPPNPTTALVLMFLMLSNPILSQSYFGKGS
uniref:Uncharacterized protein n=1 Tax=Octopus bimaculoides TaxID=37653 RepID=A0A0L8GXV9_OCTBM